MWRRKLNPGLLDQYFSFFGIENCVSTTYWLNLERLGIRFIGAPGLALPVVTHASPHQGAPGTAAALIPGTHTRYNRAELLVMPQVARFCRLAPLPI